MEPIKQKFTPPDPGEPATTEADWKKEWEPGYGYVAPDHVPGTHPAETGDVQWEQPSPPSTSTTENND